MSCEWCRCEGCCHIDPCDKEYGKPWKWWCTWYKKYEDVEEIKQCPHYKKR